MFNQIRSVLLLSTTSKAFQFNSQRFSSTIVLEPRVAPSQSILRNERGERIFSREEVQSHCTADDCWTIIDGKVYNITGWVDSHPGGDAIGAGAGQDATALFEFQHHSEHAREILSRFFIGVVDEPARYTLTVQDKGTQPFEKSRP